MRDFLKIHRALKYSSLDVIKLEVIKNAGTSESEELLVEMSKDELISILFEFAYHVDLVKVVKSNIDLMIYVKDEDEIMFMNFDC